MNAITRKIGTRRTNHMKTTVRSMIGFLGVTMMAAQLIGAPALKSAPFRGSSSSFEQAMPLTPAQKEVERLFKQVSTHAAIAARHGETLESFARVGQRLQYSTHAAELTGAKEAINAMGSDLRRLQELRPSALPWQQALIDRMEPVLVGLAGHATDAIERLNEDRRMISSEKYRDAVSNLYTYADQARNLVSVNLDYAQAREKLNRLDAAAAEPLAKLSPVDEKGSVSTKAVKTLEQRVRTELLKLPYYGVFDFLAFQVDGEQVTLSGQVNRPTLKTDAERAVRSVEGATTVSNKIEVLPLSSHDDQIRIAAYRAIYGHANLVQYRLNPHPPIRIIVNSGHMTLMGFVGSEMDRTVAQMQANSVPGAFSVTNNLQLGG
jgi:hyperosmotically inducible protein